ncbi:Protein of unknown function [Gryllus bimaculatus]|nr:Protein of unknown function [Gryllus bimaculatus]
MVVVVVVDYFGGSGGDGRVVRGGTDDGGIGGNNYDGCVGSGGIGDGGVGGGGIGDGVGGDGIGDGGFGSGGDGVGLRWYGDGKGEAVSPETAVQAIEMLSAVAVVADAIYEIATRINAGACPDFDRLVEEEEGVKVINRLLRYQSCLSYESASPPSVFVASPLCRVHMFTVSSVLMAKGCNVML